MKKVLFVFLTSFRRFWMNKKNNTLIIKEAKKNQFLEKSFNDSMENYFATLLEDVTPERSLLLLLSLTDPDKIKQNGITDYRINIINKSCSSKTTSAKDTDTKHSFTINRIAISV